MQLQVQGADHA
ncbi:hypothetical protein CSHISOI_11226 [Colletotrichum shisoi]|uniref:Uncharacterized protein n=1 Tax=Colletotrichum shisoi TaxID=2078593 RepID=A0A5Q4BCA4_9PEZI|nr:hypothetical protein CSHISOI_11226 [Colletotrichum shisoi]